LYFNSFAQLSFLQYAQAYAAQQQAAVGATTTAHQQQQQQQQQQSESNGIAANDDASKVRSFHWMPHRRSDQSSTSSQEDIKPPEPQANHMELWRSDTTMNLPEAVYKNVRISGFFIQELRLLQTFDEVVNVAKKNIKYCEPWIGQSTNPSALWCVLWKCFKLRLTRRQVESLLRSQQSPYLRALGLLYVRFCALPDTQWELYDSMLYDDDEITLTAVTKTKCTIGQFTRDLIVKAKILDIIMPRIPVPIYKRWLDALGLLSDGTSAKKPAQQSSERSRDRSRDRSRSPQRNRSRSPN
jgi:hypothetical protein